MMEFLDKSILKLLASLGFCLIAFQAVSQQDSIISSKSKQPVFIVGINVNPFNLGKSYSASTTYVVETQLNSPVRFFRLGFGIPSYRLPINSPHEENYKIKGFFIEPGFTFYLSDPLKTNTVFVVTTSGYFGSFKHNLTLDVEDANWGTKQRYVEEVRTSSVALKTTLGFLFSLSPRLKLNSALAMGFYINRTTPFNHIYGFEDVTKFTPGMGSGSRFPTAITLGLSYIID